MNEAHQRFHDWLTAGAEDDPPRDVAVHASVCPGCLASIAALDQLAMVDPGLAPQPAAPTGTEPGRLARAGRRVSPAGVLFSAAILGVGVSQLIRVSNTGGPVTQPTHTREQSVLSATATPQLTPEATPTPAQETLTPLGTPAPTPPPPVATPAPRRTSPPPTAAPTPIATAVPTASAIPTDTPTALPSVSETPIATATATPLPPTPTPTPVPSVSEPPPSILP